MNLRNPSSQDLSDRTVDIALGLMALILVLSIVGYTFFV